MKLLSLVLAFSVLAACTSKTVLEESDSSATDPAPPKAVSSTPPLLESTMPAVEAQLAAGGLDAKSLPADLDAIVDSKDKKKIMAVMKSFTIALGVECLDCHAKGSDGKADFTIATPQTKVSAKMWTDYVKGLSRKDGSAIFCDTCHEGKMKFLDRDSGDEALGAWMKTNFVEGLAKTDGSAHSCATCHGSPFEPAILDVWEK